MRALAEYVMKGRLQAVIVAVVATGSVLFAWIGAAAVALVTLRRGASQGSQVLFWAMCPALVIAAMGDTGPATTLLGVMLAAVILRQTASWQLALLAAVASGVLTAVVMATLGQDYVEEILRLLGDAFKQLASESKESIESVTPTVSQISGLLGLSNAFVVVVSLILARWWQSVLYNPGGFGSEFKSLRLSPQLTVLLVALGLVVSMLGVDYRLWALIFVLPLIFAGIALVHALVEKRKLSSNWLVIFYISCVLLDPAKILLLFAAIIDSWFDIRARVSDR